MLPLFRSPQWISACDVVSGAQRGAIDQLARDFGLTVQASAEPRNANANQNQTKNSNREPSGSSLPFRSPRIAMYQPWTGGNMDEGWTRWVLEQYEFALTSIHNADIRAGKLRQKFDAIVIADQDSRAIVDGYEANTIRPEYRGGLGEAGVEQLKQFVADGGTLITMGSACDLAIDRLPIPVRNLKKTFTREQHFAPGTILRIEVDAQHPIGYGVAPETYGFYINSPFFSIVEGFASQRTTVVARYPNSNVIASGWLKGEELMAGRAAVVSVEMNPGRVVLFGLRPQHRAQTHATFPMLFNALYLSATGDLPAKTSNSLSIRIFVTGGTFDKEYNELTGALSFKDTHLPEMLRLGRNRVDVSVRTLMMIDSLEMTDADRDVIVVQCRQAPETRIVITHGTDTMVETAAALARALQPAAGKTIVLTGAMIPYAFGSSDGLFNLGSALSFVQVLGPGVYLAMNGRCFEWDRVRKNKETGSFEAV